MTKAASNISNHVDDSGRGLRMLFGMLWRGRMIIGICVALGAVFGVMSASQIEPRYRAHGKVMFDVQQASCWQARCLIQARWKTKFKSCPQRR